VNSELLTYLIPLGTGALYTIALSVCAAVLSVIVGIVVCLAKLSSLKPLRTAAKIYIDVIRGTPLLLQLFYIYYALPDIGIVMPAFAAGVLGLTLNFGAYLAELFRGGVQSVGTGQHDASRALGLTRAQRLRYVIMPQALRTIFPALANYALVLIKDSSLVAVISVYELMRAGELLAGATFKALEIYTLVGVFYMVICTVVAHAFKRGEHRLSVPGYWSGDAQQNDMGKH
jgi:polar amino acid transport system permease protein